MLAITRKSRSGKIGVYAFSSKAADTFNVLTSPYWIAVFILLTTPLFVISAMILNNLDITTLSYGQQYSIAAIVGGVSADVFIRRYLRVALVITRTPRLPFIVFWMGLCLLGMGFEPFRNLIGKLL